MLGDETPAGAAPVLFKDFLPFAGKGDEAFQWRIRQRNPGSEASGPA